MKVHFYVPFLLLAVIALSACQPLLNSENSSSELPLVEEATSIPNGSDNIADGVDEELPPGAALEFSTDFSIRSISYDEVLSGGPPKDGIPPIDAPNFVSVAEADEWLKPNEPVIQLELNSEAKAYPLQILMWHEIANDTIGGIPVVVTFCPLCNTAIVFERSVDGSILDFGTTGRLRYSNLIMYDRQTESWWQQAEGKAIIGEMTGTQLKFVPAAIVSWEQYKNAFPDSAVLSRDTGNSRNYGQNPYTGYDDVNNPPFLYTGPAIPGNLPAVARVLTIDLNNDMVAYPLDVLQEVKVVNDRVGEVDIVVFWTSGTSSALDAALISEGKDVGTAAIYNRSVDGEILTFRFDGKDFIDEQTESTWDVLGKAVDGELAGEQLNQMVSINHFWFSWAAFKPDTRIYQP